MPKWSSCSTNPEPSDDSLRFAQHLHNDRETLFLFLERLDVEATNWPAEHAIRPAVINRKTSGGNRFDAGATAQAIFAQHHPGRATSREAPLSRPSSS